MEIAFDDYFAILYIKHQIFDSSLPFFLFDRRLLHLFTTKFLLPKKVQTKAKLAKTHAI